MVFQETFSEIPGLAELPKKISSLFESNKGVAENYFGLTLFIKVVRILSLKLSLNQRILTM
jgi:hypothetical protein